MVLPGASRPLGRAIARRFGKEGCALLLPVYDWPESIAEMEQEFTENGFTFSTFSLDLRNKADVENFGRELSEQEIQVDYLVNNIERGGMPVVHGSYNSPHNQNQWELEIDTTLKAKWLLYNICFPLMNQASGGAIINISSIAANSGRSGVAADLFNDAYSAANRAIQLFTETWAREAAPGIRVNEVMLGLVDGRHAEGTRGWPALSSMQRQKINDTILLGRTGHPEEVAEMIYFLAVQATYMTGATVRLDGGFSLGHNRVPSMPQGIL